MFKKTLSILLSIVILAGSVIGSSLVTATATSETKYYLFGDIHGVHYSFHDFLNYYDEINLDEHNFRNGTLEVSFDEDSYIAIKNSDNTHFMIDGTLSEHSNSAILNKAPETDIDDITKMLYVPAQTNAKFTITENPDGTLILSYEFNPYNEENKSRYRLMMILAANCWDFDYTPQYWYVYYTRESYDAYLATKQKAEKLLMDENTTDEELEAIIKEFKTAQKNLVRINTKEPKSHSYNKLFYLIQDHFSFDYTSEYWYTIYTKESYDAFLATTLKAEKLLADENATDEELEAMIEEFKTSRENLVKVDSADQPETTAPTEIPATTEPTTTEPATTEPATTEPATTEPATTEPITTEPSVIEKPLFGDVDRDGYVNVKDATLIQFYIAGFNKIDDEQLVVADVDRSGTVDIKDATYIQMYCANLIAYDYFINI